MHVQETDNEEDADSDAEERYYGGWWKESGNADGLDARTRWNQFGGNRYGWWNQNQEADNLNSQMEEEKSAKEAQTTNMQGNNQNLGGVHSNMQEAQEELHNDY